MSSSILRAACLSCLLAMAACSPPKLTEAPTSTATPTVDVDAPPVMTGRPESTAEVEDRPAPADEDGSCGTAVLGECQVDSFREFRCGPPRRGLAACPSDPDDVDTLISSGTWQPSATGDAMKLDSTLMRCGGARVRRTCCYSRCVGVEVHARAKSAHSYRSLACIPAMSTSHPAAGHPRCPAAIEFPGDWMGHIAAFDAEGTREREQENRSEPLLAAIEWCCYGRAPAGAIGPL